MLYQLLIKVQSQKGFFAALALVPLFFHGYITGCIPSQSTDTTTVISAIIIEAPTIQRAGTPFTINNNSEGVAHWEWKILHSDNDQVIQTSNEKSPSFDLPIASYDVLVTAHGRNKLSRHFRRFITVLPPVFTEGEADEVIDLSSITTHNFFKDYAKKERPGYKIMIKGSYSGRMKIVGLRGTRDQPVHIINKGHVEINSDNLKLPYALQWSGDNQYIIFDGKADPSIPYGFTLTAGAVKSGQIFFIAGEFNKGFEICGVKLIGRQGITHGGAALQLQASYTEKCNANNWNFEYFKVHHCKMENANAEGMYIGYFTDEPRDTGFSPHRLGQVLIYRDSIINSGWDAIQIASADEFEVHDNYVDGTSLGGKRSHSSFLSWNPGNTKGWCYRNTFKNSAHVVSIGHGRTGKDAYIYCNLLMEGTYPETINAPAFLYSKIDNTYQDVGLYVFHNTIVTTRIPAKVAYANTKATPGIPVVFAGNAIVLNQINRKKYPEIEMGKNLTDSASWIIDNVWRMKDRENEMLWNEHFHPVEKSPLLRSNFDVEKQFPVLKGGYYDREGYPLRNENGRYTYGCYSGFELFVNSK